MDCVWLLKNGRDGDPPFMLSSMLDVEGDRMEPRVALRSSCRLFKKGDPEEVGIGGERGMGRVLTAEREGIWKNE